MDRHRHTDKVAIVTGAGSGIGRATALRLAHEGARVVGCDVNAHALEETRAMFAADGLHGSLVVADITRESEIEMLVAAAGGRVDILANVAGIMDHFIPLGEVDDATWNHVLDVNLNGVMRLTRAVLPVMEAGGGGAIVNVSSEAAVSAGCAGASYTTSKHAVIGLTEHVAYFYGPKLIRANAVLPGAVNTGIGASAAPRSEWAMERAMMAMATMPPAAEADQIATVISWLASDEASNVNGACVTADGGWAAA